MHDWDVCESLGISQDNKKLCGGEVLKSNQLIYNHCSNMHNSTFQPRSEEGCWNKKVTWINYYQIKKIRFHQHYGFPVQKLNQLKVHENKNK